MSVFFPFYFDYFPHWTSGCQSFIFWNNICYVVSFNGDITLICNIESLPLSQWWICVFSCSFFPWEDQISCWVFRVFHQTLVNLRQLFSFFLFFITFFVRLKYSMVPLVFSLPFELLNSALYTLARQNQIILHCQLISTHNSFTYVTIDRYRKHR